MRCLFNSLKSYSSLKKRELFGKVYSFYTKHTSAPLFYFLLFAVGIKFLLVYVRYPDSFFNASSINVQICIKTLFMKCVNDKFVNFWSENVIRSSGKFPRYTLVDENRSAYLKILEPRFWFLEFSEIAPFTALNIGRLNK